MRTHESVQCSKSGGRRPPIAPTQRAIDRLLKRRGIEGLWVPVVRTREAEESRGSNCAERFRALAGGALLQPTTPENEPADQSRDRPPVRAASRAIGLFRPRIASGNGGGGGGAGGGARGGGGRVGGAQRSAVRAARSAGRAAAGAYAYRTANRDVLSDLGLDYDELRALDDPLEVSRKNRGGCLRSPQRKHY